MQKTHGIDPQRFVFLDESNAKTNMTRRYGRAKAWFLSRYSP